MPYLFQLFAANAPSFASSCIMHSLLAAACCATISKSFFASLSFYSCKKHASFRLQHDFFCSIASKDDKQRKRELALLSSLFSC